MLFCIPICWLYLQDRRGRDRMVIITLDKNRKYSPSQQKYISSCRFVIYVDCLLYVIQLLDRVYNVTFPAYDIYSLRRIIYTVW